MKLKIIILLISIIFIIIGLAIKTEMYYKKYQISKKEFDSINRFIENKLEDEYIAVLEIPKINLKRGLKLNTTVDEGITILDYNKFITGNIILASHSGNCDICYFSRLDVLKVNDNIYIYKDNIKYIYQVDNIEEKRKNTFKLEDDIDSITLITCKKNTNDIQIIIKGKLIRKNKY